MTARSARVAIRKYRMKDSGLTVYRMPDTTQRDREYIEDKIRDVLDGHGHEIAGMVFMVWDKEMSSTCLHRVKRGCPLPEILIPDFVRERLMAEKIGEWSNE